MDAKTKTKNTHKKNAFAVRVAPRPRSEASASRRSARKQSRLKPANESARRRSQAAASGPPIAAHAVDATPVGLQSQRAAMYPWPLGDLERRRRGASRVSCGALTAMRGSTHAAPNSGIRLPSPQVIHQKKNKKKPFAWDSETRSTRRRAGARKLNLEIRSLGRTLACAPLRRRNRRPRLSIGP